MALFNFLRKKKRGKKVIEIVDFKEVSTHSLDDTQNLPDLEDTIELVNTISSITVNGFLDATNPQNVEKYINNLRLLAAEAKEQGRIDKFMLVRNDDILPENWEWQPQSRNTVIRPIWSHLSQAVREGLARNKRPQPQSPMAIEIPITHQELMQYLSQIDKQLGFVMNTPRYLSTCHFTINTPLSHTHSYNHVESGRPFHIIDTMDNFLDSGYGYSAHWYDAYLDVSHEHLKVSEDAVVMISEEQFKKIANDPKVLEQLKQRKVVIFRGDEGLAMNMFFSEKGVFPAKPGARYIHLDDELLDIRDNSLKDLCSIHNLGYEISHGGSDGGHFSNYFDEFSNISDQGLADFNDFLIKKFPEFADDVPAFNLSYSGTSEIVASKIIKALGPEVVLAAIEEYNEQALSEFKARQKAYQTNKETITPEISQIFRDTIDIIKDYYYNTRIELFSGENQREIEQLMMNFFQSETVREQLNAAIELNERLSIKRESIAELLSGKR